MTPKEFFMYCKKHNATMMDLKFSDLLNVFVCYFLDFFKSIPFLILGNLFLLQIRFQPIVCLVSHLANCHPVLFSYLRNRFGQLLTPFLRKGRYRKPYYLSVISGG